MPREPRKRAHAGDGELARDLATAVKGSRTLFWEGTADDPPPARARCGPPGGEGPRFAVPLDCEAGRIGVLCYDGGELAERHAVGSAAEAVWVMERFADERAPGDG